MILSVGGLVRLKGVDATLRALQRIKDRHDFRFVLCGEGAERHNLERLASDLGLMDRVHFAGRIGRAEIPRYFAAADVFVHSARSEASGNVLLEAMACGRPVVCTDAGGPAEYVADGHTGFVVPVGDTEALASRTEQLLESAELANEMGRRGRVRAEEKFSYREMIARITQTYEQVTAGPSGSISPLALPGHHERMQSESCPHQERVES